MSHIFNPTILREYDIRGQVGKNLSEEDAYALGRAYGTFVQQEAPALASVHTVCVGYDGRLSSPELSGRLCQGLKETGVRVISVGLGPTPMLYFSVKHLNADAGIMVTGSHNPPDYNGFKMTLNKYPVFGETIQKIGKISASGALIEGEGSVENLDIKEDYVDRLIKDLDITRELTIGWDAGNGAAGEILQMLTKRIPGTHHLIFEDIDGNFPNHHPDPTVDKNLIDLQKLVAEKKCDLGIAYDGDGDRIGTVDENGTVIRSDMLMAIYSREVIANNPGAAIIGDVKCSQVMFDEINRLGGKGVMWKTGHSLIKDKMRELNSPLAGELSGHIFFADKYYGFDDALYCSVRLLNLLASPDTKLSDLTAHFPEQYNTPELNVRVEETEKVVLVQKVLKSMRAQTQGNDEYTLDDMDGVRVSTADGWWLLRPSNTQNVLVARIEGKSEAGLERLKKMAGEEVKKIGYTLAF